MDTPIIVEMAIESIIPSSSMQLSTALLGIENSLLRAAEANVALMGDDFTDAEREAMTTIEELKLINGMDLAAVLLRGKLLQRIEERGMWSYHPARYGSLQEMARDQGISVSNLSNIRDLNLVIFPWMAQQGMSIPEIDNLSLTVETQGIGTEVALNGETIILNSAAINNGLLTANFTVKNTGSEEINVSSMVSFSARAADGTKLEQEIFDCGTGPDGSVQPADLIRGDICWKNASSGTKIYYQSGFMSSQYVIWIIN